MCVTYCICISDKISKFNHNTKGVCMHVKGGGGGGGSLQHPVFQKYKFYLSIQIVLKSTPTRQAPAGEGERGGAV